MPINVSIGRVIFLKATKSTYGSFVDDVVNHHARLLVEVGLNGTTTDPIITDYKTYGW